MDSGAVRPNKRQRLVSENHEVVPKPHSRFSFKDGNIVLIAEDTYFRVHESLLSRDSEVFRDMISLVDPQVTASSDVPQRIEGCPVVQLTDSAQEISSILSLLYNGCQKCVRGPDPCTTSV